MNSGAGDDGEVAAPTHFSTQKAASHLIRRGGITCGTDHAVRGPKGTRSAPDKAEVYSRAGGARLRGERENLQVLGVLRATRLVLGVLLARHGRREL
eukprot:scaffold92375_cov66-Phaeocystis_antarctica.AAC.2